MHKHQAEYILLQSNVGVNDIGVQPEVGMDDDNNATTQQAAVRKELQQRETTAWATKQNKLFDRGRPL